MPIIHENRNNFNINIYATYVDIYSISYISILKANNKTTKHYNRRSEIYLFTLSFHSCYIYISIKIEMAENNIKGFVVY